MADLSDTSKIQEFVDQKYQQLQAGTISQQDYNAAMRDAKVGIDGFSAKMAESTEKLKQSVIGLGSFMVNGQSGASVYNSAIESTADLISNALSLLGPIGKVLGFAVTAGAKYVSAVNQQADKLFESYQSISRSGLATGMSDTFSNLQKFGYTVSEIGQMGELLKENSTTLAQFGGTAAAGTAKFADLSASIQSSQIGTEFQRMGMSVDDINQGIAGYMRIQQLAGTIGKKTNEELKEGAVDYIEQQTRLTKLTGLTAAQQNKVLEQAYAGERFAATQFLLRQKGDAESLAKVKSNEEIVEWFAGNVGPEATASLQKYLSGAMNDEEIRQFRRTYSGMVKMRDEGIIDVPTLASQAIKDADETSRAWYVQGEAGNTGGKITSLPEVLKLAGRKYGDTVEKNNKDAQKEIEEAKKGADPAVKAQVDLRNAQRNQTQAFDKLTNVGIVPVTEQIENLSKGISEITGIVSTAAGKSGSVGEGANEKPTAAGGTPGGTGEKPDLTGVSIQGQSAQVSKIAAPAFQSLLNSLDKVGYKITSLGGYADRDVRGQAGKKSVHALGGAIDINPGSNPLGSSLVTDMPSNISQMASAAGLGWGGNWKSRKDAMHFSAANSEGGSLMPQAASGGVLSGPKDGYDATLHGTEAVIPMDGKKAISVVSQEDTMLDQQSELLTMKITKLDQLIKGMQTHYDTSNKILMRQS